MKLKGRAVKRQKATLLHTQTVADSGPQFSDNKGRPCIVIMKEIQSAE